MRAETRTALRAAALIGAVLLWAGCRQDMHNQPRYKPLAASDLFPDGRSARPLVPGTVPRGHLREDDAFYTGSTEGAFVNRIPVEITRELLDRGHQRFDIYCSPCHGRTGDGRGMVVRRGFPEAASFHTDRLRNVEPGYLFDVITRGFGRMPDYATQIEPRDRWAVVAYVRALQLSEHVPASDLSPEEQEMVRRGARVPTQLPPAEGDESGEGVER